MARGHGRPSISYVPGEPLRYYYCGWIPQGQVAALGVAMWEFHEVCNWWTSGTQILSPYITVMSPICKLMPCPSIVKSQRREVSNGMSWILWLCVYRIISHLYQTGCFVMKGTTLGWRTLEFLRRKTVDFLNQKLIKLFPYCRHEGRDLAPTCKPARNHNVRVDSFGFAHWPWTSLAPTNLLRDGSIPSQWVPISAFLEPT